MYVYASLLDSRVNTTYKSPDGRTKPKLRQMGNQNCIAPRPKLRKLRQHNRRRSRSRPAWSSPEYICIRRCWNCAKRNEIARRRGGKPGRSGVSIYRHRLHPLTCDIGAGIDVAKDDTTKKKQGGGKFQRTLWDSKDSRHLTLFRIPTTCRGNSGSEKEVISMLSQTGKYRQITGRKLGNSQEA